MKRLHVIRFKIMPLGSHESCDNSLVGAPPKWLVLVGELVSPLLPVVGRKPASKPAEVAAEEMAQFEKRSQKGKPIKVAEFVAVAQIAHISAEPPLLRRKDGYFCETETRMTLLSSSGERKSYRFAKGTILRVIGGMLHIPFLL